MLFGAVADEEQVPTLRRSRRRRFALLLRREREERQLDALPDLRRYLNRAQFVVKNFEIRPGERPRMRPKWQLQFAIWGS